MTKSTLFSDGLNSLNAGLTPARDKNQSTSYTVPQYNRQQLTAMYRTSLAGRVVDQRAEDSFRKWREWQAKGVDISAIEKREKELKIKAQMEGAQKLANLYGMAYVVLIMDDDTPNEPIDLNRVRAGSIKRVAVLERGEMGEGPEVLDALSDYYKTPEYYEILTNNVDGILRLHPSRVIPVFGVRRIDQWGGDSVLDRGMSALRNLDATMANVASLVWEAKIDVLSIKGLADAVRDPVEEQAIMARINAAMFAKGNNGALILDADGEQYEQKKMSFATLPDLINSFQTAFAAAFGYPKSMMFEDDQGGLGNNGSSSLEKYYNTVQSDQVNRIEPSMNILDECLIRDALNGKRPDDMWYTWTPLWSLSGKEIAEIGKLITETFTMAVEKGIVEINVANEAWVNAMTEAGAANGLESLNAAFVGGLYGGGSGGSSDDNED